MNEHATSPEDREFRQRFEACEVTADEFGHRAHVRMAYVYLCEHSTDRAHERMRRSLLRLLDHLGADKTKYNETVTRAWILAVRHFMEVSEARCSDADEFIGRNPMLLDGKIMLSHYSTEVLNSPKARAEWVEPDVEPIPRH